MQKKNDTRYSWTRLLNQGLPIPALLFSIITVALIISSSLKVTIPPLVLVLIPILLIVIGFVSSGKKPTPKTQKELSDPDFPDHPITVSNFQNHINPTLLKIPDRDALKKLDTDTGIGSVTSVVGDLVFEVNDFDAPIRLTIHYTSVDEQGLREREEFLQTQKYIRNPNVELIPIYLEAQIQEGKVVSQVWKPLPDFEVNTTDRTITVNVSHWGDTNIGVGTKP